MRHGNIMSEGTSFQVNHAIEFARMRRAVYQRQLSFLCIIQMSLYFIIFCDVLQYNNVNVVFVSCCHLANTFENEYNACYLYSLGGRQMCQNFDLNGLDRWPVKGATAPRVARVMGFPSDLESDMEQTIDNGHHCIIPTSTSYRCEGIKSQIIHSKITHRE